MKSYSIYKDSCLNALRRLGGHIWTHKYKNRIEYILLNTKDYLSQNPDLRSITCQFGRMYP